MDVIGFDFGCETLEGRVELGLAHQVLERVAALEPAHVPGRHLHSYKHYHMRNDTSVNLGSSSSLSFGSLVLVKSSGLGCKGASLGGSIRSSSSVKRLSSVWVVCDMAHRPKWGQVKPSAATRF